MMRIRVSAGCRCAQLLNQVQTTTKRKERPPYGTIQQFVLTELDF